MKGILIRWYFLSHSYHSISVLMLQIDIYSTANIVNLIKKY